MNFASWVAVVLSLFGIALVFAQALCRVAADADRAMGLKD